MGYAVYEDLTAPDYGVFRWSGYAVPAKCDMPGCDVAIDRGMGYRCEEVTDYVYFKDGKEVTEDDDWDDEVEVESEGCGLQFCENHLYNHEAHKEAFPKPDEPRWLWWILNHESWEKWRDENPDRVKTYQELTKDFTPDAKLLEELQEG